MEFIYTIKPHGDLEMILAKGIRCESAGGTKDGEKPAETQNAIDREWEIPTEREMFAPRIFFWKAESELENKKCNAVTPTDLSYQETKQNNFKQIKGGNESGLASYAAIRFPANQLNGKQFPDGSFPNKTRHYAIFPGKKADRCVIKSDQIEIRQKDRWEKLSAYLGVPENEKPIWENDESLVMWKGLYKWTIGDSFEHIMGFGRSGSGKTSSLVKSISMAALRAGYGCIFSTAKNTDAADYQEWIEKTGRLNSIVVLQAGKGVEISGCNLIKQELDFGAAQGDKVDATENVVQLFQFVSQLTGGTDKQRGEETFWDLSAKQMLRNALNAIYAATGTVDIKDLRRFVSSAPTSKIEAGSLSWRRDSFCGQMLTLAQKNKPESDTVEMAADYFLDHLPGLPPETQGSIKATFSAGWAELLAREPIRSLFFSESDYTMDILTEGAAIVVDLPTESFGQIGRLANGLARWAAQRTVMRRGKNNNETRPVMFIWDECPLTLCKNDINFFTTCRSMRCSVLAAAQSLAALQEAVGDKLASKLVGNCNTLHFNQNKDSDTNELMSKVFGKIKVSQESITRDSKGKKSTTKHKELEDTFSPDEALDLKTGAKLFKQRVEGIIGYGGQKFNNKRGAKVRYHQDRPMWSWINAVARYTGVRAKKRPAPDFRWVR